MRTTFFNCTNLKSVGDLSHWDVSKVKDMTAMFTNCKKLESIDLSQWDVSNVQYMWDMFINCKNLKFINDLSKWDVSSVEIMTGMFTNSGITNIPKWYKG